MRCMMIAVATGVLMAGPVFAQGSTGDVGSRGAVPQPGGSLGDSGPASNTPSGRVTEPSSQGRMGDRLGGDSTTSGTGSSGTTSSMGSGADGMTGGNAGRALPGNSGSSGGSMSGGGGMGGGAGVGGAPGSGAATRGGQGTNGNAGGRN